MEKCPGIYTDRLFAEKFTISILNMIKYRIGSWSTSYRELASNYLYRIIESDLLLSEIVSDISDNQLISKDEKELDINSLWLHVHPDKRVKFGQFFTKRELVEHILDVCEQNSPDFYNGTGLVADIACGSGIFLQSFINRQLTHQGKKIEPSKILSRVVGIDKDPLACGLAKLSIALEIFNVIYTRRCIDSIEEPIEEWPLPRIYCADTVDYSPYTLDRHATEHIFGTEEFQRGLDIIISNFPFLEAKRMNRYDPGLKSRLKERFPVLLGAFDLYIPFIYQALSLLKTGGIMGVVLPDKFLISRYARKIRAHILKDHQLLQITDCSRVPRAFYKTSIYPIVLFVRKGSNKEVVEPIGISVSSLHELSNAKPFSLCPELFKMTGDNCTFFCRNHEWFGLIRSLFTSKDALRLKDVLNIRSTISFHKKGAREQVVKPTKEWESDAYPYLGGKSYTRENEVDIFTVNWAGHYIYYPPDLKFRVGHTMAPIDIFRRPKVIFCQHSQRLRAYFDVDGRFLTKDVYPIAFSREKYDTTDFGWLMTAYLNSSLLTVIYNTIHHGITIAQGFYHYLPAFLKEIPIILPNATEHRSIILIAKELQNLMSKLDWNKKLKVREIYGELDLKISKIHNLSEKEHYELVEYIKTSKIPYPWT